jgi:hypothetical protein
MLNAAVRNVNHAMGTELKQSQLGRAHAAADGQPRTEPKPCSLSADNLDLGQTVDAREALERTARCVGDADLTEPRATPARRSVRA